MPELKFNDQGLVPAIVQDAKTKQVLMLGWMNQEALDKTLATKESWFWSRSRKALWRKGSTSGNTQSVKNISYDCDADALLLLVDPMGPACHTGETTCFFSSLL